MVQSQEASGEDLPPANLMRIGVLARRTGLSIDAIRYYERRGVLPRAVRTASNYRLFPVEAIERLAWARRLQELGLTLDEIVDALHAHDRGGATCSSERWRLEAVRSRLEAQIRELTATRDHVDRLLDDCRRGRCAFTAT
ncbi:MAG: MerR family transcriptional regulator [Acidimicrobiales bacterium]